MQKSIELPFLKRMCTTLVPAAVPLVAVVIVSSQSTWANDSAKKQSAAQTLSKKTEREVRAPLVRVNTNSDASKVRAPLVKVNTDGVSKTKVRAPFVKVDTKDPKVGTKVRAPFVSVDTDESKERTRVRAPFVKIDRVGDKVHIRAPFVDRWTTVEEYEKERKKDKDDRDDD